MVNKIIKSVSDKNRYTFFCPNELNSLDYNYAIKIDFRSYFQFYYSLIKQNHLIISTFFIKNDYNIFLLKIALFLILFNLFFFTNTLFFNDDSLHKLYEDEGKYHLIYQIPQILYSILISQIISYLLGKLSLTQDDFLNLKVKNNLQEITNEIKVLKKRIKIKCILFIIIGFILLFYFWYYLSAFCAIYYNTQFILIKDSLISFTFNLIYPFIFYLIPGIFRIIGLKYKIKCQYIFSNVLIKIIDILS